MFHVSAPANAVVEDRRCICAPGPAEAGKFGKYGSEINR